MKKSHITRILSAAIKHESIGFIPAGTKLTPGSKKHLSDSQIIVTAGALVNYDRVYIVSLSKNNAHIGDFLLDPKNQNTVNEIKKALNRATA